MDNIRYSIRVQILAETSFFGSGVAQLLQLIDETHSLHKACELMHMAYSKGWKIIRFAEMNIGFPLLESKAGGTNGGGSEVTDEGRKFLVCYLNLKAELNKDGDILFKKYFGDYLCGK